jgi:hypothetical protein
MAYVLRIRPAADDRTDTLWVEGGALDIARRAIEKGGCKRVDIYDATMFMSDEQIRADIARSR